MDRMLLDGADTEALVRVRRTAEASRNHLDHLEAVHGLPVAIRPDGLLTFAV